MPPLCTIIYMYIYICIHITYIYIYIILYKHTVYRDTEYSGFGAVARRSSCPAGQLLAGQLPAVPLASVQAIGDILFAAICCKYNAFSAKAPRNTVGAFAENALYLLRSELNHTSHCTTTVGRCCSGSVLH